MRDASNTPSMLWSVKVDRPWWSPPWEAWVTENGAFLRSTFSIAWSEKGARREARRRYRERGRDIPGTKIGAPV